MMETYDRQGNPITMKEFEQKMKTGNRVAETTLPDGKWISTVWLGLDHRFGSEGRPVIFETMVFPSAGCWTDIDRNRYCSEKEALEGHENMIAKWTQTSTS